MQLERLQPKTYAAKVLPNDLYARDLVARCHSSRLLTTRVGHEMQMLATVEDTKQLHQCLAFDADTVRGGSSHSSQHRSLRAARPTTRQIRKFVQTHKRGDKRKWKLATGAIAELMLCDLL